MRTLHVAICACFVGVLASVPGAQAESKSSPDLTVILDFKGPYSQNSIREMQREAGLILKSSGYRLGWTMLGADPHATYRDLVVLTFHGFCRYDSAVPRSTVSGSYALTHITDGEIMPFGEVDCDRVVGAVRNAMSGRDESKADKLVGRALGRVVAHELVHMLTKSAQHASEGVEKSALSGTQLIENTLPLSALDIDRLQQEHAAAH